MKQFFDNIFLQKAQSYVWHKTVQVDDALKKNRRWKYLFSISTIFKQDALTWHH